MKKLNCDNYKLNSPCKLGISSHSSNLTSTSVTRSVLIPISIASPVVRILGSTDVCMYYYHFAVLVALQSEYIVLGSDNDLGSIEPLGYANDDSSTWQVSCERHEAIVCTTIDSLGDCMHGLTVNSTPESP
jgi:hypothetical protein